MPNYIEKNIEFESLTEAWAHLIDTDSYSSAHYMEAIVKQQATRQ